MSLDEIRERLEETSSGDGMFSQDTDETATDESRELIQDVVDGVEDVSLYDPKEISDTGSQEIDIWIPSGSVLLDHAIGRGIPGGRQVLLRGGEGSGKSQLCLETLASVQKMGGYAVYLDSEDTFPKEYAERIGFDPDTAIMGKPQTCEEAMDTIRQIGNQMYEIKDPETPVVIAWDSISNTATDDEVNEEIGTDSRSMGSHAQLFSQAYRQLGSGLWDQNITLMVVVHPKEDINAGMYESSEPQYLAKKPIDHNSSVILDMERSGVYGPDDAPDGQKTTVRVSKNKVGAPFREITYHLDFSTGIDDEKSLFTWLKDRGYINHYGGGNHKLQVPGLPEVKGFYESGWVDQLDELNEDHDDLENILRFTVASEMQPDVASSMDFDSTTDQEE